MDIFQYTGKDFGDLQQFEKKSAYQLYRLVILKKIKKKLGMSWMNKMYVDTNLSLHRHKMNDI